MSKKISESSWRGLTELFRVIFRYRQTIASCICNLESICASLVQGYRLYLRGIVRHWSEKRTEADAQQSKNQGNLPTRHAPCLRLRPCMAILTVRLIVILYHKVSSVEHDVSALVLLLSPVPAI